MSNGQCSDCSLLIAHCSLLIGDWQPFTAGSWKASMLFRARIGTMNRSAAGPWPQRAASSEASGKPGRLGPGVSAAPGDRARSGCNGSWKARDGAPPDVAEDSPQGSTKTGVPTETSFSRYSTFQLARRKQPWDS